MSCLGCAGWGAGIVIDNDSGWSEQRLLLVCCLTSLWRLYLCAGLFLFPPSLYSVFTYHG